MTPFGLGNDIGGSLDIHDPRSVDAPLQGTAPVARRAALMMRVPGVETPAETVAEIERAGQILAGARWEVESTEPPELELVTETWLNLLAIDFSALMPGLRSLISRPLYDYMMDLCRMADPRDTPNSEIHATRSRLTRLWSAFFAQYSVVIGATWTQLPWPVDHGSRTGDGTAVGARHGEVHHTRQRPGTVVRSTTHGRRG